MGSRVSPVVLQIVNVVAVIATIAFNALVNILPLNGVNTGTVSDSYPNLFTPPGYVFAIWGVIYILLVSFMVYQVRISQRRESYLRETGFLYLFGAVANIIWLIVFHYSYGNPTLFLLSPIPIFILLIILLLTYVKLGVGVKKVPLKQKLAVHVPVSVYLAWISLATIANIASVLNILIPDIPLSIQAVLAATVIMVALMITLLMLIRRRDFAYGLVVVWASIGIAAKQASFPIIYVTALLTVGIIAATTMFYFFRRSA
ncbi:MAG: tryptophan-rich sensory protein [Thermoproteota archaeon]